MGRPSQIRGGGGGVGGGRANFGLGAKKFHQRGAFPVSRVGRVPGSQGGPGRPKNKTEGDHIGISDCSKTPVWGPPPNGVGLFFAFHFFMGDLFQVSGQGGGRTEKKPFQTGGMGEKGEGGEKRGAFPIFVTGARGRGGKGWNVWDDSKGFSLGRGGGALGGGPNRTEGGGARGQKLFQGPKKRAFPPPGKIPGQGGVGARGRSSPALRGGGGKRIFFLFYFFCGSDTRRRPGGPGWGAQFVSKSQFPGRGVGGAGAGGPQARLGRGQGEGGGAGRLRGTRGWVGRGNPGPGGVSFGLRLDHRWWGGDRGRGPLFSGAYEKKKKKFAAGARGFGGRGGDRGFGTPGGGQSRSKGGAGGPPPRDFSFFKGGGLEAQGQHGGGPGFDPRTPHFQKVLGFRGKTKKRGGAGKKKKTKKKGGET